MCIRTPDGERQQRISAGFSLFGDSRGYANMQYRGQHSVYPDHTHCAIHSSRTEEWAVSQAVKYDRNLRYSVRSDSNLLSAVPSACALFVIG